MLNQGKVNSEMDLFGHKVRITWPITDINKQYFPEVLIYLNKGNALIEFEKIDQILIYLAREGFLNDRKGKTEMFPSCSYCIVSNRGKRLGRKGIKDI